METLEELLEKDLTHLAGSLSREFATMGGSNLLITGGAGFLGYYLVQSVLFWNEREGGSRPVASPSWTTIVEARPTGCSP